MADAMAAVAAASGKPVAFRDETPEEHDAGLRAAGLPEDLVMFLNLMYEFMRGGAMSATTDGVARVLGREPVRFADWAAETAKTGVWSA